MNKDVNMAYLRVSRILVVLEILINSYGEYKDKVIQIIWAIKEKDYLMRVWVECSSLELEHRHLNTAWDYRSSNIGNLERQI